MNVPITSVIYILTLISIGTSVPQLHGMGSHIPHHHFGNPMANIEGHVSIETRPSGSSGGYYGLHGGSPGFGHHAGFGIQALAMQPGMMHGHGLGMGMHGHHGGLSMASHHAPMYGEPGVRFGMGPGMGHSYFNGFDGNSLPSYGGYGGHYSASQPSVVYHGAGPGHPGIPVVDHGTARAIEEIMKGHGRDHSTTSSSNTHTAQESGNILLGIPVLKGHKITLPGFLIHPGRDSHSRSSAEHDSIVGAHSIPQPRVVYGGTVRGKPIVIEHPPPNFEVHSTYSVKYPITPVLVKSQARGQKGYKREGDKLWG